MMPEDYFDVAYINFSKAILHGRRRDGLDELGNVIEHDIEVVLSHEQKRAIDDLGSKHDREMQKLLRSFAEEPAQ